MFSLINLFNIFVLGPGLFYPFSFCPFRLPYLYCFICSSPCAWGKSRAFILLAAVGLNMNKELFCRKLCPMGTLQALLFKIKSRKFKLPGFIHNVKYIILGLIGIVLLITWKGGTIPVILRDIFLAILLISALASIFIYQIFCHNFCPIKALTILTRRRGSNVSG